MAKESCHELAPTIRKRERVQATKEIPFKGQRLPLSNLDFMLPPIDVGVFFVYQNHDGRLDHPSSMLDTLKRSLSKTLLHFYPLAGELVENLLEEPEILCNNRGVDFIEAYCDLEIAQLNLYNAEECLEGKLVPIKDGGVICIQATELKCGGLVVAVVFNHRVADAYSTNMFLLCWSKLARSKALSLVPSFGCSLLQLHCNGRYTSSITHLYSPVFSLTPPSNGNLTSRIYHVTSEDIKRLQTFSQAATKLQAFSAFLWQTIAKAVTRSHRTSTCKMGMVADGRSRLSNDMSTYFGNVLAVTFRKHTAKDLSVMKLSEIVAIVDEMIKEVTTKGHFLGLIDLIEEHKPKGVRSTIYRREEEDEAAFLVSSGRNFPLSEVDFGWGKPKLGSYHFGWGGDVGHIMPMPSARAKGDWVVYARLMEWQLEALEEKGEGFFRPLTTSHLNLQSVDSDEQ